MKLIAKIGMLLTILAVLACARTARAEGWEYTVGTYSWSPRNIVMTPFGVTLCVQKELFGQTTDNSNVTLGVTLIGGVFYWTATANGGAELYAYTYHCEPTSDFNPPIVSMRLATATTSSDADTGMAVSANAHAWLVGFSGGPFISYYYYQGNNGNWWVHANWVFGQTVSSVQIIIISRNDAQCAYNCLPFTLWGHCSFSGHNQYCDLPVNTWQSSCIGNCQPAGTTYTGAWDNSCTPDGQCRTHFHTLCGWDQGTFGPFNGSVSNGFTDRISGYDGWQGGDPFMTSDSYETGYYFCADLYQ